MPNCSICTKSISVHATRIQSGRFRTSTAFEVYETVFTCPECSIDGLYKQVKQANDERDAALAELRKVRDDS